MRAAEFLTDAYYNKNAHYMDDRSINPATNKPYINFGDWVQSGHRNEPPANRPFMDGPFPSYKIALQSLIGKKGKGGYGNKDFKIVRAGVSKFKIVDRNDPAPELFGE